MNLWRCNCGHVYNQKEYGECIFEGCLSSEQGQMQIPKEAKEVKLLVGALIPLPELPEKMVWKDIRKLSGIALCGCGAPGISPFTISECARCSKDRPVTNCQNFFPMPAETAQQVYQEWLGDQSTQKDKEISRATLLARIMDGLLLATSKIREQVLHFALSLSTYTNAWKTCGYCYEIRPATALECNKKCATITAFKLGKAQTSFPTLCFPGSAVPYVWPFVLNDSHLDAKSRRDGSGFWLCVCQGLGAKSSLDWPRCLQCGTNKYKMASGFIPFPDAMTNELRLFYSRNQTVWGTSDGPQKLLTHTKDIVEDFFVQGMHLNAETRWPVLSHAWIECGCGAVQPKKNWEEKQQICLSCFFKLDHELSKPVLCFPGTGDPPQPLDWESTIRGESALLASPAVWLCSCGGMGVSGLSLNLEKEKDKDKKSEEAHKVSCLRCGGSPVSPINSIVRGVMLLPEFIARRLAAAWIKEWKGLGVDALARGQETISIVGSQLLGADWKQRIPKKKKNEKKEIFPTQSGIPSGTQPRQFVTAPTFWEGSWDEVARSPPRAEGGAGAGAGAFSGSPSHRENSLGLTEAEEIALAMSASLGEVGGRGGDPYAADPEVETKADFAVDFEEKTRETKTEMKTKGAEFKRPKTLPKFLKERVMTWGTFCCVACGKLNLGSRIRPLRFGQGFRERVFCGYCNALAPGPEWQCPSCKQYHALSPAMQQEKRIPDSYRCLLRGCRNRGKRLDQVTLFYRSHFATSIGEEKDWLEKESKLARKKERDKQEADEEQMRWLEYYSLLSQSPVEQRKRAISSLLRELRFDCSYSRVRHLVEENKLDLCSPEIAAAADLGHGENLITLLVRNSKDSNFQQEFHKKERSKLGLYLVMHGMNATQRDDAGVEYSLWPSVSDLLQPRFLAIYRALADFAQAGQPSSGGTNWETFRKLSHFRIVVEYLCPVLPGTVGADAWKILEIVCAHKFL